MFETGRANNSTPGKQSSLQPAGRDQQQPGGSQSPQTEKSSPYVHCGHPTDIQLIFIKSQSLRAVRLI